MRTVTLVLLNVTMVTALAASALAQRNPRGTANLTLKGKAVSVEYGRPSLKGRAVDQMLSQLKAGDVWRLGADKSTTFTTVLDLAFGDVTVPAGEYSLWMQKQADNSWKLVFNKQHGQWGTQHDAAQDLVSVPLKESKLSAPVEMVTIGLVADVTYGLDGKKQGESDVISVEWGTLKVTASFTAK